MNLESYLGSNYSNYKITQSDVKKPIKIEKLIPIVEVKKPTVVETNESWYDFIPFFD